jgi:hypothetical protein
MSHNEGGHSLVADSNFSRTGADASIRSSGIWSEVALQRCTFAHSGAAIEMEAGTRMRAEACKFRDNKHDILISGNSSRLFTNYPLGLLSVEASYARLQDVRMHSLRPLTRASPGFLSASDSRFLALQQVQPLAWLACHHTQLLPGWRLMAVGGTCHWQSQQLIACACHSDAANPDG